MSDVQQRMKALSGHIYLDGGLVKSAAADGIDVIDPATEAVIGQIPETPAAEIDAAVEPGQRRPRRDGGACRRWSARMSCTRSPTGWASCAHPWPRR